MGRGFSVYAQEPEKERFIDRFSFRTNAVDWMLTIPNVSVAFDLFPGEFNKMDVLLGIRYNWNTRHQLPTYYVFNLFDGRAEYRYHFRFQQLEAGEKSNFFSLKRKNPRSWIAHYVGGYANAGTFAFKVSTNGHQGFQGGVGISYGIEMPLYQYKKGAIDLDIGASIGAMYSNFNLFTLNGANTAYVNNGKGWAVIPMLSEVRATFIWRTRSVREKYLKDDPEIPRFREAMAIARSNFASVDKSHFDESRTKKEAAALAKSDSLYRAAFVVWVNEQVEYQKGQVQYNNITPDHEEQVKKEIDRMGQKAISELDKVMRAKANEAASAARAAQREADKAAAAKEKEEKAAAKAAEKEAAEKEKAEKAAAKEADKGVTDNKADKAAAKAAEKEAAEKAKAEKAAAKAAEKAAKQAEKEAAEKAKAEAKAAEKAAKAKAKENKTNE
jgi:hypothetical protein